jgi:hypothetical protein
VRGASMSDSILKLIPSIPSFIPNSTAQIALMEYLNSIFSNTKIKISITNNIEFIDCGENFQEVVCPYCKQPLNMEWWGETMSILYEKHFIEAFFELPCCSQTTQIFDLIYKENCGFSKFVIEVFNPEIKLTVPQLSELEKILGCELKVINAYY